jgi:predicted MFS family arabinose efflux permease
MGSVQCRSLRQAVPRTTRASPICLLSALAVPFAGVAPTLGVAMSVSAYDLGTAVGSGIAGRALGSELGATGPAVVGTAFTVLTLIPTIAIAIRSREHVSRDAP